VAPLMQRFPLHHRPKLARQPQLDGAVIVKQLQGTEFLPTAHFLPWAAATPVIFGPSPCQCSRTLLGYEWSVWSVWSHFALNALILVFTYHFGNFWHKNVTSQADCSPIIGDGAAVVFKFYFWYICHTVILIILN
jgi:hypothetical protein